ncbi:hypothetical protein MKW98_004134 [Papaver atlanticum]|uniref:Glycosyl transferase CAP10 domain-containing protein n=1 Tax=Papaver atlanticum TaxID=357466 RepID=A0AAD4XPV9_9MAGN|nr:hypothetical protein MKW98_004134 [Papaver atlanticum]
MQGKSISFWSKAGFNEFDPLEKMGWRVKKAPARSTAILFIFILLFGVYMYSNYCVDSNLLTSSTSGNNLFVQTQKTTKIIEIPLNCSAGKLTRTCPTNYPENVITSSSSTECPNYFRWIHEDLRPWKNTGITLDMVERAKRTANFRLTILDGKAYMEMYKKSFHSRDMNTVWGILQLLRRYPGKLPDLDLMFDCLDWPAIKASDYQGPNATGAPPLFCYSGNAETLDIVFPDWSFWGWPEINIKPWNILSKEIKEGNKKTKWMDRIRYAYWKGNPSVAPNRREFIKCNVSEKHDWNARLYAQDWRAETRKGYQNSNLATQCTHRYKIYIEGQAWSVSEKYILACDSPTLLIKPIYYDFFTRGLVPMQHYWPIKGKDSCRSIKFAVDWGNDHPEKFMHEGLKMDNVYDYMFHLLNEYAKLLRYKPTVPPKAVNVCSETLACQADGTEKRFMRESMVKSPSDSSPCTLPLPFDPPDLQDLLRKNEDSIKEVEMLETRFWENQPK